MRSICVSSCVVVAILGTASALGQTQEGGWTAIIENDSWLHRDPTDKHYTFGVRFTRHDDAGDTGRIRRAAKAYGGWICSMICGDLTGADMKTSRFLGQSIYTPRYLFLRDPDRRDRPYGGWLYVGVSTQLTNQATARAGEQTHIVDFAVGPVGPASLAANVQRWWHSEVVDAVEPMGWDHQIGAELGVATTYTRFLRLAIVDGTFDVTPRVGVTLGNVMTDAFAGFTVRFGRGLRGVEGGGIRPSRAQPMVLSVPPADDRIFSSAYVFASAEGRAVARNIFLDGNTFKESRSVRKRPLVADWTTGFVLELTSGWRFVFEVVRRSPEFYSIPAYATSQTFTSLRITGWPAS